MNKIFFVIGASGSGKTTIVKALEKKCPTGFKAVYFDSIGIPTLEEMNTKYNGPEEWQRIKTIEWVKTIKETLLCDANVILDGQTRPLFIEEACLENNITVDETILFDCSDEERAKRLIARGHSELANAQMMKWAEYLRQESKKRIYQIIDNTELTTEETLSIFLKWLNVKNDNKILN
ncbi:MAG: AAA family ATPase [Parachlamydiaceae bacterium]|nr:AAA family ATPase [Parachlamydiaceae bacterium]